MAFSHGHLPNRRSFTDWLGSIRSEGKSQLLAHRRGRNAFCAIFLSEDRNLRVHYFPFRSDPLKEGAGHISLLFQSLHSSWASAEYRFSAHGSFSYSASVPIFGDGRGAPKPGGRAVSGLVIIERFAAEFRRCRLTLKIVGKEKSCFRATIDLSHCHRG